MTMSESQTKNYEYIFLLISILGMLSTQVDSLRLEVQSFQSKCIADEIKKDAITVGKYHIVNQTEGQPLPDSHIVSARVSSMLGTTYHFAENVTEGNFMFYAKEEGDYWTCFVAPDHKPPVTLTIEFEWQSGIIANDWSNVAKKGSVESMEVELKKMFDILKSVHYEMNYLRLRQEEARELNIATTSEMAWFSFLSLAICASVAGFQFWHLKSYFQKKKLI